MSADRRTESGVVSADRRTVSGVVSADRRTVSGVSRQKDGEWCGVS